VVPVRLPESIAAAVKRVAEREGLDRSTALRRIVSVGLDRYVAQLFAVGQISLREAAEWLDVPVRVAMDRLADAGAGGNVTWEDARAALDLVNEVTE